MEAYNDSDYWDADIDNANDWNFYFNGALKAYINDSDGSYNQFSDLRLKKQITSLESTLTAFVRLRPVRYRFISQDPDAELITGLIAQEVEAIFPEVVDEKAGLKSINYTELSVIAFKAIQDLHLENLQLKQRIFRNRGVSEELKLRGEVLATCFQVGLIEVMRLFVTLKH